MLFELGQYAESAALFDSIAQYAYAGDPSPGHRARTRAWNLTHAAEARAAAGDLAGLRRLEDSVRIAGEQSGFGRDALLHHHLRGLRLRMQGRPLEAIVAFRRAVYSRAAGYSRTNLELGRLYLELGIPDSAIAFLAPALRGSLTSSTPRCENCWPRPMRPPACGTAPASSSRGWPKPGGRAILRSGPAAGQRGAPWLVEWLRAASRGFCREVTASASGLSPAAAEALAAGAQAGTSQWAGLGTGPAP